ncbi:hypothetical protein [Deinococcus aestuarii]|uniref:hypothetical protein n=1 Tax=Deinococcus aestuarii TaxID=2774531 RepID=UPI001C0A94F3|nr:hypothetical protein [Deinococcus aestuarii]
MTPVHITLTREATSDPAGEEGLIRTLEAAGARQIDARHLRRFGLVRAEVDPEGLERVRALEGVRAVKEIGVMRAI